MTTRSITGLVQQREELGEEVDDEEEEVEKQGDWERSEQWL